MTQCSLQLHVCLLCNQRQCFIYQSSEALYGGVLIYRRKSSVYNHYTRQDCPMENTETILQYYKYTLYHIYMRSLKRSNLIKQKQPFCCLESLCFWLSFICTWNDLEICFIIYFLYSKWFCKYFMVSSQMIKVKVAFGHYCLLDKTKNTQIV